MLKCAMIMSHTCPIKGQTVTLSDTLLHTLLSETIKIRVNFVEFMIFDALLQILF